MKIISCHSASATRNQSPKGDGKSRSADFQVCCIAGFQTCEPSEYATIPAPSRLRSRRHSRFGNLRYKLALLLLLSQPTVPAATYYVATTGNDTNSGTLAQPFRTVGKGTATAATGDTVQVAGGTYSEHVAWNNKSPTLQGAGPGLSIIDGGGSGNCLSLSSGADSLIQGFAIRNGNGGGINVFQSQPKVTNCLFTGNSGGGMSLLQCNVQVNNCTFTNNDDGIYSDMQAFSGANNCVFTRNNGAGLRNSNGACSAGHCAFSNNGDGIANFNFASPGVTSCTFSNNNHGIANYGGNQGSVDQCIFAGHSASAIFNNGSSPAVTGCLFTTNNSSGSGGGMENQGGSNPTVNNCTFSGNSAYLGGGGMSNNQSSPQVNNCLFIGNNGCNAGGMLNSASDPIINNCSFVGNQVSACGPDFGAAMWNGSSNPTINNCIFWSNSGGLDFYNGGSSPAVANSDAAQYAGANGNIFADPLFVNAASGNYRLQPGSPCIDGGTASALNLPATDLEGISRILGSAPDMGAYEMVPSTNSWYVDKALGSDANPGTQASPFASVTRPLALAVNGNSIYIKQGNYGSDTPRITKPVRLFNWLATGQARIGAH